MPKTSAKVELLSYTPNPEKAVAMAARLCYSKVGIDSLSQLTQESAESFIQKLMDLGHFSPIEHASFTFGIEGVSRALLAQITRHRIASFSVQSQRYVGFKSENNQFHYIIPPAIEALGEESVKKYEQQMATIQQWYDQWVSDLGNAGEKSNEEARFVLPNACETKMVVTMNARELHHVFELRCCNRAQWEIRNVAWMMLKECARVAPALFAQAGPGCVRGACSEGKMSCGRAQEVIERQSKLI